MIDTTPLRKKLLNLAIRGKLVKQEKSDEPASELLKRIAAEKAKLVAEKKIKKEKPLPPIADEEVPFDLPKGWTWCRLMEAQWGQVPYRGNCRVEQLKTDTSRNAPKDQARRRARTAPRAAGAGESRSRNSSREYPPCPAEAPRPPAASI